MDAQKEEPEEYLLAKALKAEIDTMNFFQKLFVIFLYVRYYSGNII